IRMCVGSQGRLLHCGQAVLLFMLSSAFPFVGQGVGCRKCKNPQAGSPRADTLRRDYVSGVYVVNVNKTLISLVLAPNYIFSTDHEIRLFPKTPSLRIDF